MKRNIDHDCLACGENIPEDLYRNISIDLPPASDPLGRYATKLMALHTDIIDFRQKDMSKMDDDTKRMLISDMQEILGIKSIKST
jgi:hypothetical protein